MILQPVFHYLQQENADASRSIVFQHGQLWGLHCKLIYFDKVLEHMWSMACNGDPPHGLQNLTKIVIPPTFVR